MHRRIAIATDPNLDLSRFGFGESVWPARWIGPQRHDPDESIALVFRRVFQLPQAMTFPIHLSADQRYELYLDGQYLGRGPERGDLAHWNYESYELSLPAGFHTIAIKLWWIAPSAPAPESQQTHDPAILLFAEGQASELLSTGVAEWQYHDLPGYRFRDLPARYDTFFATGAELMIDGRKIDAAVERGQGEGWQPAKIKNKAALAALRWMSDPYRILQPATLPPMYERTLHIGQARHVEQVQVRDTSSLVVNPAAHLSDEAAQLNRLLAGEGPLVIPASTSRRVIIDLDDYYCAYPQITCGGEGAYIRLHFAESLYHIEPGCGLRASNSKGNRDEIDGKCFYGVGFEFNVGGVPLAFQPHTFMAGRYCELFIQTTDAPLTITSLAFNETHFPFAFTARFYSDDPAHSQIIPIALRTLEMCSHDTSMDCPYYERLNYVGDTRLQNLIAYAWAGDDRLARKNIRLFDISRQSSGFTSSRYPTRTILTIPTFSLWWTCMVRDFALWRDDLPFVREQMIGVRAVMEAWHAQLDASGLLRSPAGWNFVDWVPSWRAGIPAGGNHGISCLVNLQAVDALRHAAELEDFVGEPLLAQRHRRLADALSTAIRAAFYNAQAGLFADDLEQKLYSEHAQCLAVLSGVVSGPEAAGLIDKMLLTPGRAQTTVYFTHYLFEAFAQTGRIDALLKRLDLWQVLRSHGFRTTLESPEPVRSDCHAWGAHPTYHFLATLAGIRPAEFGFRSVLIRPQLGSLRHIEGRLPHANGPIEFSLDMGGALLEGTIALPEGLPGVIQFAGGSQKLRAGTNHIHLPTG